MLDKVNIEFTGISNKDSLGDSIRASLLSAIQGERKGIANLNVIIGDDALLLQLNRDYRGYDEATDVLAFDLGDERSEAIEGEIYLSFERAAIQAAERGDSDLKEAVRLVIHGFLHLCGWDHESEDDLSRMIERGESYIVLSPVVR